MRDADPSASGVVGAAPSGHPGYRPDIDGLRAVAVLPVILFHVGVRGFSGGFVGVDIFFVISGYLITSILIRDIMAGRYSIAQFYRRRILRIFPALIALLIVVTPFASLLLLPPEMARFGESLSATALFASNIIFYLRTDYFNLGALSQPLLHTWSLAVEEQWYILWPILLAAIGAGRSGAMRALAIGVTILSLGLSIWLLPRDGAATFYLLPTRAWELGLGAALATYGATRMRPALAEALAVIGLLLILVSVKIYTKDTAFPGLAAVPPSLGAALLLLTGQQSTRVGRLLSLAPVRGLGLISYSLYLWHWPVILFIDIAAWMPAGAAAMALQILVTTLLAFLSWRFVERPFREGSRGWSTPKVLAGGVMAMGALFLIGMAAPAIQSATGNFTPAQVRMANYLGFDGDGAYRRGTCFKVGPRSTYDPEQCLKADSSKPVLLFVGDSHAAHLWPGLSAHRGQYDIAQATATGCVAKLYPATTKGGCEDVINGALRDWIAHRQPAALILSSRWQWRTLGGLEESLRDPLIRHAHPILIGPMPQYSTALPRLLVMAERKGDANIPMRALDPEMFAVEREMRAIAARTGTPYMSMIDLLCRRMRCQTLAAPGIPLQFDGGHLTPEGSKLVADAIVARIAALH